MKKIQRKKFRKTLPGKISLHHSGNPSSPHFMSDIFPIHPFPDSPEPYLSYPKSGLKSAPDCRKPGCGINSKTGKCQPENEILIISVISGKYANKIVKIHAK
jgi:hypothetical protein